MTAFLEGLWDVAKPVAPEDVRHMQSRLVVQYDAHVTVERPLLPIPHCPKSWCKFVVEASGDNTARRPPQVQHRPIEDENL